MAKFKKKTAKRHYSPYSKTYRAAQREQMWQIIGRDISNADMVSTAYDISINPKF